MAMNDLWQFLTGPRLYRIYKFRDSEGRKYVANNCEVYSDRVIQLVRVLGSVALYSSPIVVTYLYRKGLIASSNNYLIFNYSFIRFATTLTFIVFGALFVRGIGRSTNNDYKSFAKVLKNVKAKNDLSRLTLSRFEFDFNHWPIDYRWYDSTLEDHKKPPTLLSSSRHSRRSTFLSIPCDLLSYIVVHTVGRRMLYPGSVSLLHHVLHNALVEGRTKLVEQYNGERYKLLARDGNQIDCMFVDRRGRDWPKAKTLVICSEGNAGFYEIGTMATPIEAGYSVLGWNHPGFAGSTGLPFPQNDINAMDVVIQFAVERLGFPIESILVFGWSIGGFPATWAAMQYPDIKGVILDASFDDVLPLAEAKMPQTINPIVRNIIRGYFNLNNSANLNHFSGAVLLIRRLRDEIINTNEAEPFRTNRGNDLLTKLLFNRFPKLMSDQKVREVLQEWLLNDSRRQEELMTRYRVGEKDEVLSLKQLFSYMESTGAHYPVLIGDDNQMSTEEKIRLILYLAKKHMKDYNSTHCTPLPSLLFEEPFDLLLKYKNRVNSNL